MNRITLENQARIHTLSGKHQLLTTTTEAGATQQLANLEDVLLLGELFFTKASKFDTQPLLTNLSSVAEQHSLNALLLKHWQLGNEPFLGKVAVTTGKNGGYVQYPVLAEVVQTAAGNELKLSIIGVDIALFQKGAWEATTEQHLGLAAAILSASSGLEAVTGGTTTTVCSTKSAAVSEVKTDHLTPLLPLFEQAAHNSTRTLTEIGRVAHLGHGATGQQTELLTVGAAAHLHGKKKDEVAGLTKLAGNSGIAAGVPVHVVRLAQLPKPFAFFAQTTAETGQGKKLVSMQAVLRENGLLTLLPAIAVALGFTTHIVDTPHEYTMQEILNPAHSKTPLSEILRTQPTHA